MHSTTRPKVMLGDERGLCLEVCFGFPKLRRNY
jgi:hypothetical protein